MRPKLLAIGVITGNIDGYYFGAMLNGIYQVTRAAGVPLLAIQGGLENLRLPPIGVAADPNR